MPEEDLPQRTWLVAVATIIVSFIGTSLLSLLPYAEWKASVSWAFIRQSETTDQAMAIFQFQALKPAFAIYYIFLLGTIPFLIRYLRHRRLWISMASIFLLMIPMLWYAGKVSHVAWKFVDWDQIALDSAPPIGVARPNAEHEGPNSILPKDIEANPIPQ